MTAKAAQTHDRSPGNQDASTILSSAGTLLGGWDGEGDPGTMITTAGRLKNGVHAYQDEPTRLPIVGALAGLDYGYGKGKV